MRRRRCARGAVGDDARLLRRQARRVRHGACAATAQRTAQWQRAAVIDEAECSNAARRIQPPAPHAMQDSTRAMLTARCKACAANPSVHSEGAPRVRRVARRTLPCTTWCVVARRLLSCVVVDCRMLHEPHVARSGSIVVLFVARTLYWLRPHHTVHSASRTLSVECGHSLLASCAMLHLLPALRRLVASAVESRPRRCARRQCRLRFGHRRRIAQELCRVRLQVVPAVVCACASVRLPAV